MTSTDDLRRSPWPVLRAGDHVTIEKPNGDRLRRDVVAGMRRGDTITLGVWLTPAHWANVDALQRDGWSLTAHEPVRSSHDSERKQR